MSERPIVYIPQFVHEPGPSMLAEHFSLQYSQADQAPTPEELAEHLVKADAVLCHAVCRLESQLLASAPRLRVVANVGVGYDNIDVAFCTAHGIAVCNTPGTVTEATADHAFALLLSVARRTAEADRFVRAGNWLQWSPQTMVGSDVHGATLGIIGLGRIGLAVARRARGFDMRLLYTSRTKHAEADTVGASYVDLSTLLRDSDFVSVHVPATAQTRHLMNHSTLGLMKPTAYLVNTSRGATVDQVALYEALRDRRIAGAALDVFDREPLPANDGLLSLDNVVLVPHIASASLPTRQAMARMAATNVIRVLTNQAPLAIVNPEALSHRR